MSAVRLFDQEGIARKEGFTEADTGFQKGEDPGINCLFLVDPLFLQHSGQMNKNIQN